MAARQTARATSAGVGMAVGVVSIWVFGILTGITPPAEVSAAWGTISTALTGWFISEMGI